MTGRVPVGGRWISQRLSGSAGIPSVIGDIGMNGMELIDSLDFESAVNSRSLCWTGIPSACGKMKTDQNKTKRAVWGRERRIICP